MSCDKEESWPVHTDELSHWKGNTRVRKKGVCRGSTREVGEEAKKGGRAGMEEMKALLQ